MFRAGPLPLSIRGMFGTCPLPSIHNHFVFRLSLYSRHLQREFEDYLKCGRLEHGFLPVRCADCHAERLRAFSCKRPG